jgi:hypothetical protein
MKNNKIFSMISVALVAAGMGMSSCADKLDLAPIDYFGAGNFWKTEAQAIGNIHNQMASLRGKNFDNAITYGELRGGAYTLENTGSDGAMLNAVAIVSQNLSQTNPGMSNFGGYWGLIEKANLFIANVENAEYFAKQETKDYCLGMVYGMRAYYYFIMYRNYGGVPLRLTPDVENGNYDTSTLYMARATASQTMAQIKSDLQKSLQYFGNQTTFNFNGAAKNAKYYWSKAASEMLAGQVYLWNAKVTVGDQAATPGDITTAKTHFENVVSNYGLELQENFADVFSATNKQNSEMIFAYKYDENEATNSNLAMWNYGIVTGYTIGTAYDRDGNLWDNPDQISSTVQRYQFSNALYYQFDAEDTRRDVTFNASYHDQAATQLRGTFVRKMLGNISAKTSYRAYDADQPVFRLAEAYLALAEIANYEGDATNVEKYVNIIRERAYGANWDAATYGYKAGSFVENEVAILHEKDKEFVQEGHRWYDVRRMTTVKGGSATDHFVFQPQGHIAYGLTITADMKELSASSWEDAPALVVKPILGTDVAHRVLWPLSTSDLNNDPELEQTPGYEVNQ